MRLELESHTRVFKREDPSTELCENPTPSGFREGSKARSSCWVVSLTVNKELSVRRECLHAKVVGGRGATEIVAFT